MALHTKKQFSELCGLTTKLLSTYAGRGKVVYSGDYVDDTIQTNIDFLKKHRDKVDGRAAESVPDIPVTTKELTTLNVSEPKYKAPKAPKTSEPKEKSGGVYELSQDKIQLQIENLELKNRELEQKLNIRDGLSIPKEPVLIAFKYLTKNISTSVKNDVENLITRYEKCFTSQQFADIRKGIVKAINHANGVAVEQCKIQISEIILVSSNKKEVGERE